MQLTKLRYQYFAGELGEGVMKKRGVTIVKNIISLVVIFICLYVVLFVLEEKIIGYFARIKNQKADDEISQAVHGVMDGRSIYYQGSEVSQKGNITVYTYFIGGDKTVLPELVEAVNEAMSKNEKNDRVRIVIWKEIFSGTDASLMAFTNYSEKDGGFEDYNRIQMLELWGIDIRSTIYNEPATYEGFQGITYLKIRDYMAEITAKENIDWYEYFPDLETLEIVPMEQ